MAQVFSEWFQGISRSRADSKGFPNLVNCDIHSEIGYVMPQLALAPAPYCPVTGFSYRVFRPCRWFQAAYQPASTSHDRYGQ